jgi:hypothetical protein
VDGRLATVAVFVCTPYKIPLENQHDDYVSVDEYGYPFPSCAAANFLSAARTATVQFEFALLERRATRKASQSPLRLTAEPISSRPSFKSLTQPLDVQADQV